MAFKDKSYNLRTRAEARLSEKQSINSVKDGTDLKRILHELQVHQIELEMQNEELRAAQITLEESRDQYFDIFEFAPVGYITLDNKGIVSSINLTACSQLGLERNDLINSRFSKFISPQDTDRWYRLFINMIQKPDFEKQSFEIEMLRGDASRFYAHLSCQSREAENARPILRIALVDVSELKVAQENLRNSEEYLRLLFENSPTSMVAIDPSTSRVVKANLNALTMWGYDSKEILTKTIDDLTHPDDLMESRLRNEQLFKGIVDHLNFEKRYIRKDGSSFWAETRASTLKDARGKANIYIGSTIDISKRKAADEALKESETFLRLSQEVGGVGSWEADLINNKQIWSDNCIALLGFPPLKNPTWEDFLELVHPDDRQLVIDATQAHLDHRTKYDVEFRAIAKNGDIRWMRSTGQAERDANGKPIKMRGIGQDVTEHKRVDEELRIAAVAFKSQSGMIITDSNGVILRVNPAFTRLTGYSADEAIGKTPALLSSGRQDKFFYQRMWKSLKTEGNWQGEIWNRRKNGLIYAEMLNIAAIISPEGNITHYVGSFTDITENKEAEAEIHRLAYYDPLTKLPNRRLMQDRLGQAVAASARSNLYGAIFFIDLDNFKALNDTRGHDVGDLLLVEVAMRLRKAVREGDTVARQGGDEFVVLMEDMGEGIDEAAALAKHLADKLCEVIDRPFVLNSYEYHCKLSMGISLFNDKDTVENLLKHADLALYQAKNAGRNTLRFFDPAMQAALELRSALEAELRQAIEFNQLRLYYQPQVDSKKCVISAEALLRWQHPQRGLVQPDDFIGVAEDTGIILSIGLWVLETACTQLKTWENDSRTSMLQVAVNVSARQFRQPDFVLQIQKVLEDSAANPV